MVISTDRVVKTKIVPGGGERPAGPNGSSRGDGGKGRGGDDATERFSPSKYRIGMWVALAAVAMMFTALTSAYIVRANTSNDWHPLAAPSLLWVSTALIVLSSVTFEIARRALMNGRSAVYNRWLVATVLLGLAFLATQLLAWRQLVAQGIYLSSNPHSSFFYVLTGAHAVHLLGGILALDYLLLRSRRKRRERNAALKEQAAVHAISLYWHFMDGLWIYLFLLLFLWR
ncbi:MAG TPA: cytochrome c oxidase subunit 3 [Pyrinomonadaceae bacterium]